MHSTRQHGQTELVLCPCPLLFGHPFLHHPGTLDGVKVDESAVEIGMLIITRQCRSNQYGIPWPHRCGSFRATLPKLPSDAHEVHVYSWATVASSSDPTFSL